MPIDIPDFHYRYFHNPRAAGAVAYGERQRAVLSAEGCRAARAEISTWPGYAPTPLVDLPGLAKALGLGRVRYKDESRRFELNSFKALGGAYAVMRLLIGEIERRKGISGVTSKDLLARTHADVTGDITVTCATDGNHGRSVAWGARNFGCNCTIFIHATVSEGRKQAIERYGARVERVAGNYDDSIKHAARAAAENGWFVVSDTSYEGYMDVPRDVMQGYTVMADEIVDQLEGDGPSHLFVQGGVGGFPAAVISQFWETWGTDRPRAVVVEPDKAACIFESMRQGHPTAVAGDLDTVMAGLACGEVSLLAWEILDQGADDVMEVSDAGVPACMRLLARGADGDPPLVAGESAVAGLLGLIAAMRDPDVAGQLGLGPESDVLLIGSEGDTDPELYREIVGQPGHNTRTAA
ncbi:diaminopropionate ammonia-lyase [Ferruginivarius sediminum]|uniref:Diaminopropionate ammonia-lyase n=1 Tax=Ferruginivarius sediminum TaxID=2661937 RepID=A0A369TBY3_9PROT|nr:diaminopropionate ammonia-lyase [Ferruginivarius sediminum]RDD62788.1 diaminopropionate ammonia-lyase [Ferruginivarius sediminum]